MLLSCTVAVVLTVLLPVVTSVTEAAETGAAATGHHLNHPDETGTAAHRLPTAASTSLNHPDETGTAAHRLPTAASTSLNHPDKNGTAATGNHLNHPVDAGTAAAGHQRLPTSPFVGHADDQTVENLMDETPSSAPSDDETTDEYRRMTPATTTQTIKPMDNGTVKREKRQWAKIGKVGLAVAQQLIPGATKAYCEHRTTHCYCGRGRCVDRNTYKKGDVCCSEGREWACCPDEPTTPAPNLEHCSLPNSDTLFTICDWLKPVGAYQPRSNVNSWHSAKNKFVCYCQFTYIDRIVKEIDRHARLFPRRAYHLGVCVKDCNTVQAEMLCDCGWGNCKVEWVSKIAKYHWVCGCCSSLPLWMQRTKEAICFETKEVAPTDEIMETPEVIPTDAANETKLDWTHCKKLAQQHCLCGWATCRQMEQGYNASLCCAAGYELQCCDSDDSKRTVVNPIQCRVAHRIKFGQDIQVEYSTTGCDASSHFCYMAHCYKKTDPRVSYTEWGCKQNKTECGVKERLATWMGRGELVNNIGARYEDMECSDCKKGPEGISMSNEKVTPWDNPMPKPDKLSAAASSVKVRCTNRHRCFPLFLERGELSEQQMTFKLKRQYLVRRTKSEAVHPHCDHTVTLLCKAAAGFLTDFIFDEFYAQTQNGAFLDEYTKVRASC